MKKSILMILFVFITVSAFCQTMTFNDLQHLLVEKNEDKYLRAKGFTVLSSQTSLGHTLTHYVIHSQSPKTEMVLVGLGVTTKSGVFLHEAGYTAMDTAYVHSLMKQIVKAGFKLTGQKPGKKWDSYRFDNKDFYTQVFIEHQPAIASSVNIRRKNY